MSKRRQFGSVRKLPSGKWQARWQLDGVWYSARRTDDDEQHRYDHGPLMFSTKNKALDYLGWVAREIEAGRWRPPVKPPETNDDDGPPTLRTYADAWLAKRRNRRGEPLRPSTRESYRGILDNLILPTLGDKPLTDLDQDALDRWWAGLPGNRPTYRAHAYQVLRAILRSAHRRKLIAEVPSIDGAGRTSREREIRVLDPSEVAAIAAGMPERYRAMVLLSAWCALRYGEVTALTRAGVDTGRGILRVRRGVTRTKGQWHVSTPKGGVARTVDIPSNIADAVKEHVADLAPDELLFPAPGPRGGYMLAPTFGKMFRRAAAAIGRTDVRVHDLRHFGATRFAMAGASLPELMDYTGHKTVSAVQVYFNVARGRRRELTDRMAAMATVGNVVPIEAAKSKREAG